MSDEAVLYEAREGVAVITLNRPDVLNAFTKPMLGQLAEALGRAKGERAVLLTGSGRGFSAGQDLASIKDDYANGGPDFVSLLRDYFHPVITAIRSLPVPVVAGVNGVAAGAGFSLALACDLRIAADNARFATAFTGIGLVPDCGMAYTLPRLVGPGRAAAMLMAGGPPMGAADALAAGIVDRVVPAAEFADEAFGWARTLANGPTRAFALTKQLLAASETMTLAESLELEAELQAAAGKTEDHRNAVQAFLAKQPPEWKGR